MSGWPGVVALSQNKYGRKVDRDAHVMLAREMTYGTASSTKSSAGVDSRQFPRQNPVIARKTLPGQSLETGVIRESHRALVDHATVSSRARALSFVHFPKR